MSEMAIGDTEVIVKDVVDSVKHEKAVKDEINTAEAPRNKDKCPCSLSKDVWKIKCMTCGQWWHNLCANLKHLDEDGVNLLTEWECPYCWSFPFILNTQKQALIDELSQTIKEEVKEVQEVLKSEKEEKVTFAELLRKNSDDIETKTKKVIETAIADENSKLVESAMNTSKRAIDSNFVERQKRRKNVVLINVRESKSNTTEEESRKDKDMAVEICGVAAEEIRSTYRPGPPLGEGRNKDRKTPRPHRE